MSEARSAMIGLACCAVVIHRADPIISEWLQSTKDNRRWIKRLALGFIALVRRIFLPPPCRVSNPNRLNTVSRYPRTVSTIPLASRFSSPLEVSSASARSAPSPPPLCPEPRRATLSHVEPHASSPYAP